MIGLGALAGAGIPVQMAANHRLEEAVRSPALSVALAFATGGLLMAALALSGVLGQGQLSGIASAPWWVWTGGLLSVIIVIASIPREAHMRQAVGFVSPRLVAFEAARAGSSGPHGGRPRTALLSLGLRGAAITLTG